LHHVLRASELRFTRRYREHSEGFSRAALVNRTGGSIHMDVGLCLLAAGGSVDVHVHSFEESFFILDGHPILVLDGQGCRLRPGACGVVPVGVPHAWVSSNDADATWIEMCAPQPRTRGPADTFFVGPPPDGEVSDMDVRDSRSRHLFLFDTGQMDLDALKTGAAIDAPTVSASMATALLAYSGIGVKMLVDKRLDAQLSIMFMVEYEPGGVAHPHDHPLEESYLILEGEVEAVADDQRYTLKKGDFFWTGVGCVHAFYNTSSSKVRWLETAAPQPPDRHSYRFNRDWEYLEQKLHSEAETGQPKAV
jgi:quercetin dioxygenase-like cupin family protein